MPVITRRKRPISVQTLEWTGLNAEEMHAFCGDAFTWRPGWYAKLWNSEECSNINFPVGHHAVKGPLGELYPLSPTALELTYELPDPDQLLADSEALGQAGRPLNYPPEVPR